MNQLYELLFCPIHGILAPKNLPLMMPAISGGILYGRRVLCRLYGKRSKNV